MLLLVAMGLVVVGVAWWITSREAAWDEQTDGMVIAVAGAMVAAYGVTSWLLRARALCAARRRVMFAVVGDVGTGRESARVARTEPEGPADHVVAHPEHGRYHRPTCALAVGHDWPTHHRDEVADRRACGVCRP